MWLQAEVAQGNIRLENPADILTKCKSGRNIQRLLAKMNIEIVYENTE